MLADNETNFLAQRINHDQGWSLRSRRSLGSYWSWYYEGMRVVDFSSCAVSGGFESCTPIEVAHFVDDGTGPDSLNDHSNFWGVYVHDHPDGNRYILGSDRDSGFWVFSDAF